MLELQRRAAEQKAKQKRELEKAAAMRAILTPEARQRLANMRLVKPDLASRVEEYLIRVVQTQNVKIPVDDEELKALLRKLIPRKRRTKIERR